jgi:hypothetical protein
MKVIVIFIASFLLFAVTMSSQLDSAPIKNPVVPNARLGQFSHGTYPSAGIGNGNWTHAGTDLVAPCGSEVFAFADGEVKETIDNKDDRDFRGLGFMVLVEHAATLIGKPFYTLYLHMQETPRVKPRDPVKARETVLGKVGDTGKTIGGCHTHFEIRYFANRYSRWGNIYGRGDQRASKYFQTQWADPLVFFRQYPEGLTLGARQTEKAEVRTLQKEPVADVKGTTRVAATETKVTRSKAADMIRKSRRFREQALAAKLCIGVCPGDLYGWHPLFGGAHATPTDLERALSSLGYIQIREGRRISLTDKGSAAANNWKTTWEGEVRAQPTGIGKARLFTITLGYPELVEVTGIIHEGNTAIGEYTWRWVPNSIGNEIIKVGFNEIIPREINKDTAVFILYDDGWRLAH